ncbi:putative phage holin [Streptomyces achromogenes]|uniref:putative phage holin n=1 Tax=Streptomyces achromogenes TaxID=67255 RepID=UPI0034288F6B
MTDLGVDEWVNIAASTLAFAACVTFAATYHLRAAWWRSEVGRNLMAFATAVGLLCLYTVLATVWQADACVLVALRALRTLVLLAVAGLMMQRTRLLLRAQRESRNRTGV